MGRNGTLDHARLLAACGIVVFHSGAPGASLGHAALPFFLILLVVLAAPVAGQRDLGGYARDRARRLLLPWLEWSILYGALKLAEVALTGAPLRSEFAPYMLLTGPALHLWFLPFAFAACLLVHPLMRLAAPERGAAPGGDGRGGLLSLCLCAAGLGMLALGQGQTLPAPLAQWLLALPAVCLGLGVAVSGARPGRMLAALTGFAGLALAAGWTSGLLQIVLAVTVLALCLALPRPGTRLSRQAGGAALGIYLAHPLVLSVLERTTSVAPQSLAMAGLACLGALAVSGAAARLRAAAGAAAARRMPIAASEPRNTPA